MLHKLSFYKTAADLLHLVKDSGKNVKSILYSEKKYKFMNIKALYALVNEALKHWSVLEILIEKSKILIKEPNFNVWHVRILLTELLFGKKELNSDHEFVLAVLKYEKKFRKILLKEDVQNLLLSLPESKVVGNKVRYVKVNTIKSDITSVINTFKEEGWQCLPKCENYQDYLKQLCSLEVNSQQFILDFQIAEVLAFPPGSELYEHELYKNGAFYFMDKSSCLAPYLLQPQPQTSVLDMCAAPGLKTIHLAALVPSGRVFAVENNASRFKILQEMVSSSGAENVVTVPGDVSLLNPDKYKDVEYILLDPSCSGSGMRDRQPRENHDGKDLDRLYRLQSFQLTLLRFALTRFPLAKRVVYSTCSLNVEENEEVVHLALASKYHNFEIVSVEGKLPGWNSFGSDRFNFGPKCLYCLPESDFTNGFFVAVFERKFEMNHHKNEPEVSYEYENDVDGNLQSNSFRNRKEHSLSYGSKKNSILNETEFSKKRSLSENSNEKANKKFKRGKSNSSIGSDTIISQHKEVEKTKTTVESTKAVLKKIPISVKKRIRRRKLKSHVQKPITEKDKQTVLKDSSKKIGKLKEEGNSVKGVKSKDINKSEIISKSKIRYLRLKKHKLAAKSVQSGYEKQNNFHTTQIKSSTLNPNEASETKPKKRKKSFSTEHSNLDISQYNILPDESTRITKKTHKKNKFVPEISSVDNDNNIVVTNDKIDTEEKTSLKKKLKKKLHEEKHNENMSPPLSDIVQNTVDESSNKKKKKSKVDLDKTSKVKQGIFEDADSINIENNNVDSKMLKDTHFNLGNDTSVNLEMKGKLHKKKKTKTRSSEETRCETVESTKKNKKVRSSNENASSLNENDLPEYNLLDPKVDGMSKENNQLKTKHKKKKSKDENFSFVS